MIHGTLRTFSGTSLLASPPPPASDSARLASHTPRSLQTAISSAAGTETGQQRVSELPAWVGVGENGRKTDLA
jgi:hypothetical protein